MGSTGNAGDAVSKNGPGRGRPRGSKNRTTVEVREAAAGIVGSARYRAKLKARAEAGKLAPAVEVALWQYAYGKPREQVEAHVAVDYRWLTEADETAEDLAVEVEALALASGAGPLALVPPASDDEDGGA